MFVRTFVTSKHRAAESGANCLEREWPRLCDRPGFSVSGEGFVTRRREGLQLSKTMSDKVEDVNR